jgi:hypothetical protein
VQNGGLGLGTLFTLWIPLLQSLRIPPTMLPFCLLSLGSLYLTLTTTCKPYTIVGSTIGKTTIFYLVTSTSSTPLDILIPWIMNSYSTT